MGKENTRGGDTQKSSRSSKIGPSSDAEALKTKKKAGSTRMETSDCKDQNS